MSGKVCVVVPTYNNASTLASVVGDILSHCPDVIVVNDGSTDSTGKILEGLSSKVMVVNLERNRGKGKALKAGFEKARELGFTYAITMDSDAQHKASDIPSFLTENEKHPGALLLGVRKELSQENKPKGNTFANRFSNFWFHLQTGLRLPDTQCGFRLYPLESLGKLSLLTSRYEAELEMLVFQAWKGVEIIPIPVDVAYPEDRVTHFRPVMDFVRITILNTVLCILTIFYALPLKALRALSGRNRR